MTAFQIQHQYPSVELYVITGESLGSEALIYAVFEFINLLVELPKFHPVIKENIKQLIYYITIYTQMTTEQVSPFGQILYVYMGVVAICY